MFALALVLSVGLLVSFICSVLEAVLLSITHSYVALLKDEGARAGRLLEQMRANIDEPIAAILTLNTIAHTVSASLGGALALQLFGQAWIAIFAAAITLAILVFSEILPKTIGATYWKLLAAPTAYLLRVLIVVLKPVLVPLAWFNRLITPRGRKGPTVSRAEIDVLAEIGRREGSINEEEWQVVTNVMNLKQVRLGQVMTPRTRIAAIDVSASVLEARELFIEEGHRRYPVYQETIDNVIGLVTVSDVLKAEQQAVVELRTIVRPAPFVPESMAVQDLIRQMRRERVPMAIVVDEFGGTAGLVTMEDLFEEIIGDIRDEHDPDFEPLQAMPDGSFLISGQTSVVELNRTFDLEIDEGKYTTVAGFLLGRLGRMGRVGDVVTQGGSRFEIVALEGHRIDRIRYSVLPPAGHPKGGG
jgi:CBS domain containing-hemolysin-like protein